MTAANRTGRNRSNAPPALGSMLLRTASSGSGYASRSASAARIKGASLGSRVGDANDSAADARRRSAMRRDHRRRSMRRRGAPDIMHGGDAAPGVPEQFADGRVAVALVRGDDRERSSKIMGARISQTRFIE